MVGEHDDRHLEAFLAECVHESLANYQLSNAVFLCERLYAACPTEVRPAHAHAPEHHGRAMFFFLFFL